MRPYRGMTLVVWAAMPVVPHVIHNTTYHHTYRRYCAILFTYSSLDSYSCVIVDGYEEGLSVCVLRLVCLETPRHVPHGTVQRAEMLFVACVVRKTLYA